MTAILLTHPKSIHFPPPKSRCRQQSNTPPPSAALAMGSVSLKIGDGTARFRSATICSSALHLVMLASVLITNLFALYAFTSSSSHTSFSAGSGGGDGTNNIKNLSLISEHVSLILREIDSSERKLHQIERELSGFDSFDPASPRLPPELKLFLARHRLPLGPDSRSGIAEMVSAVGHSCSSASDLLSRYMSYNPAAACPSAASIPADLISKGCEPLPRRRCLTRAPKPSPLLPFPQSLWPPSAAGLDRQMWVKVRGKNDFLIDEILSLSRSGGIRIGLDIDGGSGDFAARMAERNVTVVTSALSGHELVASRGLFPLLVSPAQRFPFSDSVFDLVHTTQGLDGGAVAGQGQAQSEALEFLMFDIDRVLRSGGLLWFDNYLCVDDERKRLITRLVERFRYKKLKWVVGEKAAGDGGGKPQIYLSAVLQKPSRG